jgi:hypothetical protein
MASAEEEAHGQRVKEKGARETGLPTVMSWPTEPDGTPMAVVVGAASDLVPTVPFGNVQIGPVTIMRPVTNGELDQLIEDGRAVQKAAQFIVGAERRIVQWATDPSSRVVNPATQAEVTPAAAGVAPPAAPSAEGSGAAATTSGAAGDTGAPAS